MAYQQGNWGRAEKLCRNLLRGVPDLHQAMGLLGIVKARMNQPTEAAHWFAKVVELEPRDAAAQSNLGNALQTLGRLEEALSCYERAIAINPGAAIAHLNRGAVLQALGRNEEALASYDLS